LRLAYVELHRDERAATVTGFVLEPVWQRLVALSM